MAYVLFQLTQILCKMQIDSDFKIMSHSIILDSGKQKDVKSSFTFTHGMILLSAVLAIAVGFFVTKEIVKNTRRRKKKQQLGIEKKQENLNQVS